MKYKKMIKGTLVSIKETRKNDIYICHYRRSDNV